MISGQLDAILTLITYFLIFYFHETGHYGAAKLLHTKTVEVRTKFTIPYCVYIDDPEIESSRFKMIFISVGGIVTGLIPIIGLYFIVEPFFQVIPVVFLGFYFVTGCWRDFRDIVNFIIRKRSVA